jgi:hypothetical protein
LATLTERQIIRADTNPIARMDDPSSGARQYVNPSASASPLNEAPHQFPQNQGSAFNDRSQAHEEQPFIG